MEVGPVDAPVVPLQHVLHHGVRLAEQVGGVGVSLDLVLEALKLVHVIIILHKIGFFSPLPPAPGATDFFLRPDISQTLTNESSSYCHVVRRGLLPDGLVKAGADH